MFGDVFFSFKFCKYLAYNFKEFFKLAKGEKRPILPQILEKKLKHKQPFLLKLHLKKEIIKRKQEMNILKRGWIFALLSIFLLSCNNDDDNYSLGDFWLTTGTVIKTSDHFYVVNDEGEKLWPSASNVDPQFVEDSMRAIVNYTILGDATDNPDFDYYVKINSIKKILTKPVFHFTNETSQAVKDSIGNDAVTITSTWFTGKYLNVQFEYGGGFGYIHYINLVKDDKDPETENGEIILELKHNKNGDPSTYLYWGIASFDLTALQVEGESSVDILVRALGKSGQYEYNKVLTYEYVDPQNQAAGFLSKDFTSTFE